jgi:hypothetical protein
VVPDEYIFERIIPWIIKWFFFYEEWLASGEWKGGGKHPELPQPCRTDDLDLASRARRDQFRNAEFHRLGQRIGVFASSLLMEAASAGSVPPQSWLDLRGITPADLQSHLTSILLQVPRQAAFSLSASERTSPQLSYLTFTSSEDAKYFLNSPKTSMAALRSWLRDRQQHLRYLYDRQALQRMLTDQLGEQLFGQSKARLVIPAFEGKHSEVFVYKTPHHEDYKTDRFEWLRLAWPRQLHPLISQPPKHNG